MKKKANGFFKDFKAFITKGNVVDLAVAVVIGGAFNKIVTGFVNNIIMPLMGLFTSEATFADLKWCIKEKITIDPATGLEVDESIYIAYGAFIQAIIDFLVIAFCVFLMIRTITKIRKKFDEMADHMQSDESKAAEEAQKAAEEAKKAAEAAAAQAAADKEKAVKDAEIKTAKTLDEIVVLLEKIANK